MELDWIKCEDCIEGMKSIPDGAVDMILVDPPYGTTNNFWDKQLPMSEMWEEFKRVTKHNAAIVIFSQLPFAVDLINANRKMFRYEWIWHKDIGAGFLNARKMPMRIHENILVFYRKLPTYNPQFWQSVPLKMRLPATKTTNYNQRGYVEQRYESDGRRYPTDCLKFARPKYVFGNGEHYTPTEKPVGLLEYLIKTYTNEGELVLDACMGSGSTAVAAVNTNRHFIGYETHQPFVDICNRRIAEAREKLLQAQTSVLEGFEYGDNNQWGDNERDGVEV